MTCIADQSQTGPVHSVELCRWHLNFTPKQQENLAVGLRTDGNGPIKN